MKNWMVDTMNGLIAGLIGWLIDRFIHSFIDWSIDWLIDWLLVISPIKQSSTDLYSEKRRIRRAPQIEQFFLFLHTSEWL